MGTAYAICELLMKFSTAWRLTRTDTLSASERAYQAVPRTRRITARASGE